MEDQGRTFEDVIFGAILGVWSTRIQSLTGSAEAASLPSSAENWQHTLVFLGLSAILAICLRLVWTIETFRLKLLGSAWMIVFIAGTSAFGWSVGLFTVPGGLVFGSIFVAWFATAILAEGVRIFVKERWPDA